MIKDNQKRLNNFHVVLDAIVILLSYALAWYIQIGNPWSGVTAHNKQAMAAVYLIAAVIIVPLYLILYAFFHLYTPKRVQGRRLELANILKANTIGLLSIALVLFACRKNDYFGNFSGQMLVLFFVINVIARIFGQEHSAQGAPFHAFQRVQPGNIFFWLVTAGRRKVLSIVSMPIRNGDIRSGEFLTTMKSGEKNIRISVSSGKQRTWMKFWRSIRSTK